MSTTSRKRRLQLRRERRRRSHAVQRRERLLRERRLFCSLVGQPPPLGRRAVRRAFARNRHPNPLVPQYRYPVLQP